MRRPIAMCLLSLLAACGNEGTREASPPPSPPPVTTDARLSEPYAYVTPTPPDEVTPIDGVFTRKIGDDLAGPSGACRRCPPYRMEEGLQTLRFERGVFFVDNEITAEKSIDWQSIGHYTVEGSTVTLFNDPNCTTLRGTYEWSLEGGTLILDVVDDPCAFGGLRWRYLTAAPWSAA